MLLRRLLQTTVCSVTILLATSLATSAWDECPWSTSNCCSGAVGDMNGDGENADPVDLSYLVDYLFMNGSPPFCADEADLNQDGSSGDPVDLSFLVDYLFAGANSLPACP